MSKKQASQRGKDFTPYKQIIDPDTDAVVDSIIKGNIQEQPKPQRRGQRLTGEELIESLNKETKYLIKLKAGRPPKKTLQDKGEWERTSFVCNTLYVEKLRRIADRERITLKAVVNEAFKIVIETYEAANGEIDCSDDRANGSAEGIFSRR